MHLFDLVYFMTNKVLHFPSPLERCSNHAVVSNAIHVNVVSQYFIDVNVQTTKSLL
jgi:hypothetical protein